MKIIFQIYHKIFIILDHIKKLNKIIPNFFSDLESKNDQGSNKSSENEVFSHLINPSEVEQQIFIDLKNSYLNNDPNIFIKKLSYYILCINFDKRFVGKYTHLKKLDNLLITFCNKNNKLFPIDIINNSNNYKCKIPLIISTEVYSFGGHSRYIEELSNILSPTPLMVKTNFFEGSSRDNFYLSKGLSSVNSIVLDNIRSVDKIKNLIYLMNKLASEVYLVVHQHDVVSLIASKAISSKIPVYFIHHSDHRPALGTSFRDFIHIDGALNTFSDCQKNIKSKIFYWHQGITDHNIINFKYPIRSVNISCSGSSVKFLWDDSDLSLPNIICALLKKDVRYFYFLGDLEPDKISLIKQKLQYYGINENRFKLTKYEPSLWLWLQKINTHIYLGSFPIHGLRSSIEAQGCGLPLIVYIQHLNKMKDEKHYNESVKYWNNIDELKIAIRSVIKNHVLFSKCSRNFYENNYSLEIMKNDVYKTKKLISKLTKKN